MYFGPKPNAILYASLHTASLEIPPNSHIIDVYVLMAASSECYRVEPVTENTSSHFLFLLG